MSVLVFKNPLGNMVTQWWVKELGDTWVPFIEFSVNCVIEQEERDLRRKGRI